MRQEGGYSPEADRAELKEQESELLRKLEEVRAKLDGLDGGVEKQSEPQQIEDEESEKLGLLDGFQWENEQDEVQVRQTEETKWRVWPVPNSEDVFVSAEVEDSTNTMDVQKRVGQLANNFHNFFDGDLHESTVIASCNKPALFRLKKPQGAIKKWIEPMTKSMCEKSVTQALPQFLVEKGSVEML
jgi:hypothetical protein